MVLPLAALPPWVTVPPESPCGDRKQRRLLPRRQDAGFGWRRCYQALGRRHGTRESPVAGEHLLGTFGFPRSKDVERLGFRRPDTGLGYQQWAAGGGFRGHDRSHFFTGWQA